MPKRVSEGSGDMAQVIFSLPLRMASVLVYVYHNVIDNVGEHNESKVFDVAAAAIKEILDLGCGHIAVLRGAQLANLDDWDHCLL